MSRSRPLAGLSTPAAGTLTLSGTTLNVTTTSSVFSSFALQNGSQQVGYLLQAGANGLANWVSFAWLTRCQGSLGYDGSAAAFSLNFANAGTPLEVAAGVLTGANSGFDSPSAGRLRYTGSVATTVRVNMVFTFSTAAILTQKLVFFPAVSGVQVAGVTCPNWILAPQNDYVSVFCKNSTSTSVVAIQTMGITAA